MTIQEQAPVPNRAKTHCPQGHEYTPENTLFSAGRRHCRKCSAKRSREYQARKRREAGATPRPVPPDGVVGRAAELISQAIRRNAMMDRIDRKYGNPTPVELPPVRELNVAIEALLAGLATEDWETVAQGTALAAEALARLENSGIGDASF